MSQLIYKEIFIEYTYQSDHANISSLVVCGVPTMS